MKLNQISIFVENKPGRLLRVAQVLGQAGVDLRAMCVADTKDFGILRCIVSDMAAAAGALDEAEIMYNVSQVIGVEVPDEPSGLERLLEILTNGDIAVEYLYSFAGPNVGRAVIIFHVSDIDAAIRKLQEDGQHLISASDLA